MMTGCSSNDADSPSPAQTPTAHTSEPPRTVVDGVEVPVTYGDFQPDSETDAPLTSDPPELEIAGTRVPGSFPDWSAVSGASPAPNATTPPPKWHDIAVPSNGEPLLLTFESGPLPAAVSVVCYDAIDATGYPSGAPQRDHGVIPAAGVAKADVGLTLETRDRFEYLAVQFRWLVPEDQRAKGQAENTSVTTAYLIHLTPTP
jgi:hypothetical protein